MHLSVRWLVVATALLCSNTAHAQDKTDLEWRPVRDGIITGGSLAMWLSAEILFKDFFNPDSCNFCERDDAGRSTVNGVDANMRDLRWDDLDRANTISDVTCYLMAPGLAFGLLGVAAHEEGAFRKNGWEDAAIIAEAAGTAAALRVWVKAAVARERPYYHLLTEEQRANDTDSSEPNVSFYSGHTSMAFSLAVASGTVASLRGYKIAPAIWLVGLATAFTTGYLRIAADKHYFTDVVTGAVIGSAAGFAIPYFLHRQRKAGPKRGLESATIMIGPTSPTLSVSFLW